MLVRQFMTKAQNVVTCQETAPISSVIDTVMDRNISAVVVVDTTDGTPVGIVTKTDLVRAYQQQVSLDCSVSKIMGSNLKTVVDTMTRDDAAKNFELHENHHAIVVDKDDQFVGLISSWDIAAEVAKDSRAWPWNRTPDNKISKPMEAH